MTQIQTDENQQGFDDFLQNIQKYFSRSDDIITKKRNIIKRVEYNGKKIVVKSFKTPNVINKFAYRFIRASKAKRSFLNAQRLIKLDIKTPKPIAYVEFFEPLLEKSFYVCEYFDFDFEMRDVLADNNFRNREKIFDRFIEFSYDLHQKGVYHVDYSPGNVLIKQLNDKYVFSIVDVNRMAFMEFNDKLRLKNLSRFSASKKDTEIFAKKYAKISNIDESFAIEQLFFYHQKHQKYLRNKKRLKTFKY